MKNKENNFAYIDGANLHEGIKDLAWKLDYKRFRIWLSEKYGVSRAYIFLGLIPKFKDIYTYLQEAGFTLIFKEVTHDGEGKVKGNCDADLVLRVVCDVYENVNEKAVIVSGDGDYAGLVKFLIEKNKLRVMISPNNKCSVLLKRTGGPISYLDSQRSILEKRSKKEKAPDKDGTL